MLLAPFLLLLQGPDLVQRADALRTRGFAELGAYSLLDELVTGIGPRLSGSPAAARAVVWGQATMERLGFQNVRLIPCMVPHWVRGTEHVDLIQPGSAARPLTCCALGNSVGTPKQGITAPVVEVHSIAECKALGAKVKDKIVFFNGAFDSSLLNTFAQYGKAAEQRFAGPSTAASQGAVGVLVRSLTTDPDDVPHTGALSYVDGVPKIPAAALSVMAANTLSGVLANGGAQVTLTLGCKMLPDEPSADVVGEWVGTEKPNEVVVMGGHLDSWDKGRGAHDDGAGVTQSLEALHLLQEMGWKPKRTIRVVLFMNEENGERGAEAYAAYAKGSGEKPIASLESDSGGFAPRTFSSSLTAEQVKKLSDWMPALQEFELETITAGGGGGADVGPLSALGSTLFGLEPESQRYFDYHHSDKDTLDNVNPRELELGSMAMAMLVWLVSENGLP